jgi:hypothetical protein
MIGRDPNAAHCVIDDQRISKLHTCVDLQDGMISIRDVGSMNGTYVGGSRLAPNCWVRPGVDGEPVELTIGPYKILASAYQDDAGEAPAPASLAELVNQIPGHQSPEGSVERVGGSTALLSDRRSAPAPAGVAIGTLVSERRSAPAPAPAAIGSFAIGTFELRGPVVRLAPTYANAQSAMAAFCDALAQELEAVPAPARAQVCKALVTAYPNLPDDPRARAVLERNGWRASFSAPPAAVTSLGGAALVAMQELAAWYVGRDRTLTTPAEVTSFKDKLRATLDEFMLGFPALLESMSRFEQQMAIQSGPGAALPSSPARLAAVLLDWTGSSDSARQRLRASFAELTMHNVALLNGVMTGVKAILTELSPAQIEKAADGHRHGLFARADPWTVYKRRHSDLADEENERFRLLFGPEFVEEYRQFTQDAPGQVKA